MVYRAIALTISGLAFAASAGAQSYKIPAESAALLAGVDLAGATPFEDYRQQFDRCDGTAPGGVGKDRFRGHPLPATRRCSTDPNRVRALMRLADGGIYWDSKMALDVDGSHVATSGTQWTYRNGRPRSTTDQCGTSLKWSAVPGGNDCQHPQAHVDPDIFPYIAIPGGGAGYLPAAERQKISGEFRRTTGLSNGDMGIVVYRDRWTPAFIADAGAVLSPGRRIGESACGGGFQSLHPRQQRSGPVRRRCDENLSVQRSGSAGWRHLPVLSRQRRGIDEGGGAEADLHLRARKAEAHRVDDVSGNVIGSTIS